MRRFVHLVAAAALMLAPVSVGATRTSGDVAGIIKDSAGVAHAGYQVRARQLSRGAQVVAVATTGGTGRFALPNLAPDDYVVEALTVNGQVVATSRLLRVVAGGSTAVDMTAMAPPQAGGLGAFLTNPLVIAGIVATAVAVPVAIHNNWGPWKDASPSR